MYGSAPYASLPYADGPFEVPLVGIVVVSEGFEGDIEPEVLEAALSLLFDDDALFLSVVVDPYEEPDEPMDVARSWQGEDDALFLAVVSEPEDDAGESLDAVLGVLAEDDALFVFVVGEGMDLAEGAGEDDGWYSLVYDETAAPVVPGSDHVVGFIVNVGTLMGRR